MNGRFGSGVPRRLQEPISTKVQPLKPRVRTSALVNVVRTEPLSPVNNPNLQYEFRIEIYYESSIGRYSAHVLRGGHFHVSPLSETDLSTEYLYTVEESFGFEEISEVSQELALSRALDKLLQIFVPTASME